MDWPSNSSDLNSIENLWCIVKYNVERRTPKNCEKLKQFMEEKWQNILEATFINLADSMKRRCKLSIDNGERIPY